MEGLSALAAGRPWPMGAHADTQGVNFAVFSAHAQRIDLCLFDADGRVETARAPLPGRTGDVWHGRLPGAAPGLVYGLRAHGPWSPQHGQRFNADKLLLDPYAREIVGEFAWRDEHFAAAASHGDIPDRRDNAAHALKARVVADHHDWGDDAPLHTPLARTVLYELHVRGFSRTHPGVPEPLRGTYAGLASDAAIAHLQRLGVTAVSLLPVHQHLDEQRLARLGLRNYWGYNTIGFFCPSPRLAAARDGRALRDEFRAMVRRLHRAGIEVILDVVYNHTAESDETGPNLSLRGLDNASYYRLDPHDRSRYENHTGCGNTLDLRHPHVLQLVMDSLRYWVGEMHVDGFRFDLAPVLGRSGIGFDRHAAFFAAVAQDPVLSRVKLIAEPWDVGPGGYQLGNFPAGWLEWNDRFRDSMRRFWVRGHGQRGEFAQRLCASADVFQHRGRAPSASVNYIVSHDGFTLRDLLSHDRKHNLANGESNADGHHHNHSWNCGVEGDTDDAVVRALRGRLSRALLATTLLAQGTPMLAAGDEIGHSQHGNNNPYCQDHAGTWIDWSRADHALLEFTTHVLALRRQWLPLAERWYDGLSGPDGQHDLSWFDADGTPMHAETWRVHGKLVLLCRIGRPGIAAGPLLLIVNAHADDRSVHLPPGDWAVALDSAEPSGRRAASQSACAHTLRVPARCLLLLAPSNRDQQVGG